MCLFTLTYKEKETFGFGYKVFRKIEDKDYVEPVYSLNSDRIKVKGVNIDTIEQTLLTDGLSGERYRTGYHIYEEKKGAIEQFKHLINSYNRPGSLIIYKVKYWDVTASGKQLLSLWNCGSVYGNQLCDCVVARKMKLIKEILC